MSSGDVETTVKESAMQSSGSSASSSHAPNSDPVQSTVTTNPPPEQDILTLTVLHPPQSDTDSVPENVVDVSRLTVTVSPSTLVQVEDVVRYSVSGASVKAVSQSVDGGQFASQISKVG
jgi:hypothetical protein